MHCFLHANKHIRILSSTTPMILRQLSAQKRCQVVFGFSVLGIASLFTGTGASGIAGWETSLCELSAYSPCQKVALKDLNTGKIRPPQLKQASGPG